MSDKVFDLLNRVVDRDSFVRFVQALAEEREAAQELERREPLF